MRAASLWGTGIAFLAACEARTVTAVSSDAAPAEQAMAPAGDAASPMLDAMLSPDSGPVSYSPYNPEADATLLIALDADLSTDVMVEAALPAPPTLFCDGDFPDGEGVCPALPPVCADALTLVSYQNGLCLWGRCVWQPRVSRCSGGCRSGACAVPPTR
jgi:hypothetical protein